MCVPCVPAAIYFSVTSVVSVAITVAGGKRERERKGENRTIRLMGTVVRYLCTV